MTNRSFLIGEASAAGVCRLLVPLFYPGSQPSDSAHEPKQIGERCLVHSQSDLSAAMKSPFFSRLFFAFGTIMIKDNKKVWSSPVSASRSRRQKKADEVWGASARAPRAPALVFQHGGYVRRRGLGQLEGADGATPPKGPKKAHPKEEGPLVQEWRRTPDPQTVGPGTSIRQCVSLVPRGTFLEHLKSRI